MKKVYLIVPVVAVAVMVGVGFASAQENDNNERGFGLENGMMRTTQMMPVQNMMNGNFEKFEKNSDDFFNEAKKVNIKENAPESLNIGPNGGIKITEANLDSINGSNLVISVWGLKFNVNGANANVTGSGAKATLADMKAGDKLMVSGIIDRATGVVNAQTIHDRSIARQVVNDIESQIQKLMELINQLRAKQATMQSTSTAIVR